MSSVLGSTAEWFRRATARSTSRTRPSRRDLFTTAFWLGCVGFGGGISVLSQIDGEVVKKRGWLTAREFSNTITVSQMLPGGAAANALAYIGMARGRSLRSGWGSSGTFPRATSHARTSAGSPLAGAAPVGPEPPPGRDRFARAGRAITERIFRRRSSSLARTSETSGLPRSKATIASTTARKPRSLDAVSCSILVYARTLRSKPWSRSARPKRATRLRVAAASPLNA